MTSHRNENPGVKTMFNFTFSTNLFGARNVYLSTGTRNGDPIYVICFDKGTVRSYVV